jgi:hypothetical protein
MASIAKWTIGRSSATAQRKRCLSRQIDFVALGIDHLHHSIWIFNAQRPVRPNRNRDLSHETSEKFKSEKILYRTNQVSGVRFQVSGKKALELSGCLPNR